MNTDTQNIETIVGLLHVTRDERFTHHFVIVEARTGNDFRVRALDHVHAAAKHAAKRTAEARGEDFCEYY